MRRPIPGYRNRGISAREICNLASLVFALQRKMWRTTEYLSKTLTPQASSSSLCMGENMAVGLSKPWVLQRGIKAQICSPQTAETDAQHSQTQQ